MTKHGGHQRNLLVAKALFFSTAMSAVGWTRFQNNYYLDKGFSSSQIGFLKSIGMALKCLGEPVWCFVADLTSPKLVLILCMIMQVLSMELLRQSTSITFELILLVKILRSATSPSNTLTTTVSYKLTEGTNEGFGRQRLYGSLAWGSGAFIAGSLIDLFGMASIFFYTYFFVLINFFCVAFGVPYASAKSTPSSVANNITEETTPGVDRYFWEIQQFFRHPACRNLLLNALAYGTVMVVADTFFFVSLEVDFRASRTYSGICTGITALSCMPMFYYSDTLLHQFGHFRLILFAECTALLRLVLYAVLVPQWSLSIYCLLLVQLLHGFNFALFWAAAVDALYRLSPPNLSTSCMSTLNVMYFTFSGAVGNMMWGYLYDRAGGVLTVYLSAATLLGITIVFLLQSEGSFHGSTLSFGSTSTIATAINAVKTKEHPEKIDVMAEESGPVQRHHHTESMGSNNRTSLAHGGSHSNQPSPVAARSPRSQQYF